MGQFLHKFKVQVCLKKFKEYEVVAKNKRSADYEAFKKAKQDDPQAKIEIQYIEDEGIIFNKS